MANPALRLRVRHGIFHDPILGHRCVRQVNGHTQFLGPWTDEATAEGIAQSQARLLRDALTEAGHPHQDGDTPLDLWIPATVTSKEPTDG